MSEDDQLDSLHPIDLFDVWIRERRIRFGETFEDFKRAVRASGGRIPPLPRDTPVPEAEPYWQPRRLPTVRDPQGDRKDIYD